MSVRISDEERFERLRELRETVNNYPIIPVFKEEEELKWSLQQGNMDFIINATDYQGAEQGGRGLVRPIKSWCYATAGFLIRARNIEAALHVMNSIVEEERGRHGFLYFRVTALDMPFPRVSYVDEAMRELEETERELSFGSTIRRELHDC